jgi:hypothetical protein
VLDILLEADGGWISKSYLVRTCGFKQAGARIYELENEHHWTVEHSNFTDEYDFARSGLCRARSSWQCYDQSFHKSIAALRKAVQSVAFQQTFE